MEDSFLINVDIPLDEDGFFDRQCPAEYCNRYFKVKFADWKAADPEVAYCPFCGVYKEANEFSTGEQRDYFKEVGEALMQEELEKLIKGFASTVNRQQSRNKFLSINMTTKFTNLPVPLPPESVEVMELQIQCDVCECAYAVVGAGFFCPLCGKNSSRQTFRQSIAKARNAVEIARLLTSADIDPDAAAEAKRGTLEHQIEALVTAFQRFGEITYQELPNPDIKSNRNLFQRLIDASKKWELAGGRTFEAMLDPQEWIELRRYFQQRHLLSHQDGFVDVDYVRNSGDKRYAVGQRLVIDEVHALRMADLVEKLSAEMQSDLPTTFRVPTAASPRAIVQAFPPKLPGLAESDWKVYRIICELAISENWDNLYGQPIFDQVEVHLAMNEEEFHEAIVALESKTLIKASWTMDQIHIPLHIKLTFRGLELLFRHTTPDYLGCQQEIGTAILDGASNSADIQQKTTKSKLIIVHVLRKFELEKVISEIHWSGGIAHVYGRDVVLKRFLEGA